QKLKMATQLPDVPACTFSLMTYNVWKTDGVPTAWATRRPVLLRALRALDPDVLLVQELHPDIGRCILEALPGHRCIEDDFAGWTHEGNIFFRSSMFESTLHGSVHISQEEELRRLFWTRLRYKHTGSAGDTSGKTVLFATAHFTWQGHPAECKSDLNLRKKQSRLTADALTALQAPDEPCFFGGDLNESFWPRKILSERGFCDCFSALQLPCQPTHPAHPVVAHEEQNADQALDWLFARPAAWSPEDVRGEKRQRKEVPVLRPILASVIRSMCGLSSDDPDEKHVLAVTPSDHCPVMAVYRF
ncbi:unnamed protein product, partial [Polarella glacialis]